MHQMVESPGSSQEQQEEGIVCLSPQALYPGKKLTMNTKLAEYRTVTLASPKKRSMMINTMQ